MRCPECQGLENHYDDRLCELVCNNCGLVLLTNEIETSITYNPSFSKTSYAKDNTTQLGTTLFTDDIKTIVGARSNSTVARYKRMNGSKDVSSEDIRTEHVMAMYLSSLGASSLLTHCKKTYHLVKKDIFRNVTIEIRASSVVYYVLRDTGNMVSLRKVAKVSSETKSVISKYAKKIARFFGNATVFIRNDPIKQTDLLLSTIGDVNYEQRKASFVFVEYIARMYDNLNLTLTNNGIAGCVWLATSMIDDVIYQPKIVANWPASEYGLRKATRDICQMLKIEKNRISEYDLEEIVLGIRM